MGLTPRELEIVRLIAAGLNGDGGAIFAFGLYGLLHNATQTVPANA